MNAGFSAFAGNSGLGWVWYAGVVGGINGLPQEDGSLSFFLSVVSFTDKKLPFLPLFFRIDS